MHRAMAIECFDLASALEAKKDRSPKGVASMNLLACAAVFHAERMTPVDPRFLVAATWQAARVHYQSDDAAACDLWAQMCRMYAEGLGDIYLGYALEALARAEDAAGRTENFVQLRALARRCAANADDQVAAAALSEEVEWRRGQDAA
jgi:hypothetical protein